jgi:hypothetical protein
MTDLHEEALTRARERVEELKGFYIHLAIYVVINVGLYVIDFAQGDGLQWAYWVTIGWGIGILVHLVSLIIEQSRFTARWEARKVAEYAEQEERDLADH